jgi:hypothetical protein
VEEIGKVRVATGRQVERLVFHGLGQSTRSVVRRRVLARLVSWRVLTTLARRIGGAHGGSAGLVFALDAAGQLLLRYWNGERLAEGQRVRRPWTPGRMFLDHTLSVSELYVRLVEASRVYGFELITFLAEPASWSPNGLSGWLKPDAYVVLSSQQFHDSWWVEVDRATETVPTVRHKLTTYLDFVARGQVGPGEVIPRVLITVPDEQRRAVVAACAEQFPSAPAGLFTVMTFDAAVPHVVGLLLGSQETDW